MSCNVRSASSTVCWRVIQLTIHRVGLAVTLSEHDHRDDHRICRSVEWLETGHDPSIVGQYCPVVVGILENRSPRGTAWQSFYRFIDAATRDTCHVMYVCSIDRWLMLSVCRLCLDISGLILYLFSYTLCMQIRFRGVYTSHSILDIAGIKSMSSDKTQLRQ